MVKAEKLDCCHTVLRVSYWAMEQQERNLNVAQLRKCARYFRALAAVPETTATARAELVRAAGQFEALARQRTIEPPTIRKRLPAKLVRRQHFSCRTCSAGLQLPFPVP